MKMKTNIVNNSSLFPICLYFQHTDVGFQALFKARPELEGLIAQINL